MVCLPAAAHCSRRKISLITCERFSRAWFHTARRAEAAQKRRVCRAGAARAHCAFTRTSARARWCTQRMESNGGFGFQTKVKDRFLNQRRWTCWYFCRENMQVLSATEFSFTFCFRFEKLVIFAVYLTLHKSQIILMKKTGLNVEHFRFHITINYDKSSSACID